MLQELCYRDGQPVFQWVSFPDDGTCEQARNLALHPKVCMPVALMPDAHQGYGMPIGGVIAVDNALIPNAVGVDIGCGMCSVNTGIMLGVNHVSKIREAIQLVNVEVPMGFNHHEQPQNWTGFKDAPDIPVVQEQLESARCQLGTLGGGNHFIELQTDPNGVLWVMIHSGSRNIGYKVAKHYHDEAVRLCERWASDLPDMDLAFLPFGEKAAAEYYEALKFAQEFAFANRQHMMMTVLRIVESVWRQPIDYDFEVNIHHNFAQQEHHKGRNVWIHRKGATQAKKGQLGIIPGSMGTKSYIVRGLGNVNSYESCSHGAGRRMGRKEFCRTHSLEEVNESIKHIEFAGWGTDRKGNVEFSEAPGAYKDIDEVMNNQRDLVEIVTELRPLGVAKG